VKQAHSRVAKLSQAVSYQSATEFISHGRAIAQLAVRLPKYGDRCVIAFLAAEEGELTGTAEAGVYTRSYEEAVTQFCPVRKLGDSADGHHR